MTMIPVRDVSLFVKPRGHGEPLVLMHGGPSLDHMTLAPFELPLDSPARCPARDLLQQETAATTRRERAERQRAVEAGSAVAAPK
jgi:hypothetical protein